MIDEALQQARAIDRARTIAHLAVELMGVYVPPEILHKTSETPAVDPLRCYAYAAARLLRLADAAARDEVAP